MKVTERAVLPITLAAAIKDTVAQPEPVDLLLPTSPVASRTVVRTHLAGLDPAQTPRRTAARSMTPPQRAVLRTALAACTHARAREKLAELDQDSDGAGIKEPALLTWHTPEGPKRYTLGCLYIKGSYGKFRFSVDETGQPLAVKEFRMEARRARYVQKVTQAARELVISGDLLPEQVQELADMAAGHGGGEVAAAAEDLRQTANVPARVLRKLTLKTAFTDAVAMEREYALHAEAATALQARHSVRLDGRTYNFSRLLQGELFGVLTERVLTTDERRDQARSLLVKALEQLVVLHDLHIVHRDLKLENLLFAGDAAVHIGDFGFALKLTRPDGATGRKGTPEYVAPEVLAGRAHGLPVDVFSLGVTIAVASMKQAPLVFEMVEYPNGTVSTGHEALKALQRHMRVGQGGAFDTGHLRTLRDQPPVTLPYGDHFEAAWHSLVDFVLAWHGQDPALCELVIGRMMAHDPAKRPTVHDLLPLARALQPADSRERRAADDLLREVAASDEAWAGELEVVRAYAQAFAGPL